MKKILSLSLLALLLSCNNSTPTYKKCIETSYSLNNESIEKLIEINETEGSFKVEILNNNQIKITDSNGKITLLNDDNGFSVANKTVGDTLVVKSSPTADTSSNILRYATEYKFYN